MKPHQQLASMTTVLAGLLLLSQSAVAESILCTKDYLMSSAVGLAAGPNGVDHYRLEMGVLTELFDGRPIFTYESVQEHDGLIVAALRQEQEQGDFQVVVIDRKLRRLAKTVVQGNLRFTSFGACTFAKALK